MATAEQTARRRFQKDIFDYVTPQMFDVIDDPADTIDQTALLQAWLDYCVANGKEPHVTVPTRCKITSMLTYDPTAVGVIRKVDMRHLYLRPASGVGGMRIGATSARVMERVLLYAPSVASLTPISWSGANGAFGDHCGLILCNLRHSQIHLNEISFFTVGVAYHGENASGFAYNSILGGIISDCKYAEVLRNVGSGFTNENNFFGGARRCNSANSGTFGDAYGTYFGSAPGAVDTNHNNNRWYGPAYELGAPASATYRVPVFLDGVGSYNAWYKPRNEGGKGPFGIAKNSKLNTLNIGVSSGLSITSMQWLQVAGGYGNIIEGLDGLPVVWHSGPLSNVVTSQGPAANSRVKMPFILMNSTSGLARRYNQTSTYMATNTRCVQIMSTSCFFGIEVDTSIIKDWEVNGEYVNGTIDGSLIIQALDDNGAILADSITDSWGTEKYVKFNAVVWSNTNFGGTFSKSNPIIPTRITFRDEVKRARIGFNGDSVSPLALKAFSLKAFGYYNQGSQYLNGAISIYDPLPLGDSSYENLASAKPDTAGIHGHYAVGEIIGNLGAVSGQPLGWICTTAGWLAAAWVASTVYRVPGQVVTNDTGKMYECMTIGTAAGSGGPTGTGAGTAWQATTAYSVGDYVSNGGLIYKCTVAGTSAGSGGPTGQQSIITDGTVTWSFVKGTVPIVDGTAIWQYIGTKAAFTALANL